MTLQKTYDMIPDGELRCVWMDAGLVDFKLCDQQFRCEGCPFDEFIRQQLRTEMNERAPSNSHTGKMQTDNLYFEQQLSALLSLVHHTSLPTDRMYSDNHLWFKRDGQASFRSGIDHYLLSLVDSISSITFVRAPAAIQAQSPCAWIGHEGSTLPLKMPLAATITGVNNQLRDTPYFLKLDPYDEGWVFRVTPESEISDSLLSAEKAETLYRQQADEFRTDCQYAFSRKYPAVGATLYDGGTPVGKIEDILGPPLYFQILLQRFFLQ